MRPQLMPLAQARLTRPPRPTRSPPPPPLVRFRPDRLRQPELLRQLNERQRQPSSQEIDIFEQQEISKSRPQVGDKIKEWYGWLVNHVPEPIKEKASRAFKAAKDKIMGLYKWVKGEKSSNIVALAGCHTIEPETIINLIKTRLV